MSLPYPQRLGRDVYNSVSLTLRNRSVIDDLAVLIAGGAIWGDGGGTVAAGTGDARPTGPEHYPSLEETVLSLIVDGSPIVVNGGTPDWYCMEHCVSPEPRLIYEYTPDSQGQVSLTCPGDDATRPYTKDMRVFVQGEGSWVAYRADGKALALLTQRDRRTLARNPAALKAQLHLEDDGAVSAGVEQLFAFANGYGLLYHAQHVYNRIEELAHDIRDSMSKVNRLPVISGETGPREEAAGAINSARHAIIFPGPITIERMVSEAVMGALRAEFGDRLSDLYDGLNVLDNDGANRPVANDRALRMQVMLQFVDNVHAKLSAIYAAWGARLSFRRLVVTTAAERQAEKTLLDGAQLQLGDTEYKARVRALFGL